MKNNTVDLSSDESTIRKLADRFGMDEIPVEYIPTSDWNYVARHEGNKIVVDSAMIADNKQWEGLSETKNDILTHEYGHHVYAALNVDENYYDYGLSMPSIMRKHGGEYEGSLLQRMGTIAKKEGLKLSEYATTNQEEYFSEAFVAYNKGKKYWKLINPEILEIFKKLDTR